MARKMGSNGPKLQIREKNGHYYAYTSTSRMVDGKKKTVNECLGVYDPETGAVTPKKPMKSNARIRAEMNPAIDFSKVGSRSYGGVYLLDGIQRRIHLGEDLSRSFGDNRTGMFVMLCSQDVSWELMMAAYNARRLTEQAFDSEKERDDRLRSGDSVTVEGRYLIQFVSQIMLAEIRAVVREKNLADRYPVQSLLATLSTLNVLEYGGRKGLSEITKNVRRILEVFDLGVPSAPLYHADMFDMSELLHPVAKGDNIDGRRSRKRCSSLIMRLPHTAEYRY